MKEETRLRRQIDESNKNEKQAEKVSRKDPGIWVRVYRIAGDESERKQPIEGGGNHRHEMFSFMPGEKVRLNKTQLNIIKSACPIERIPLGKDSGVYSHPQPQIAAGVLYPEHTYTEDINGNIYMVKKTRLYSIEYVDAVT